MKARAWVLAALLAAGPACHGSGPVLVRVEVPGLSPFPPGSFAEVIVAGFRNEAPLPDLDPAAALQADLAAALDDEFDGPVSVLPLPAAAEPAPPAWVEAAAGRTGVVFLTGSVRLTSQVRKAVLDKHVPVDSPFRAERRALIEQVRWTLAVDLAVVSGATGETLYRRGFREDRDYGELDKPAEFAFADLADAFRARLFPVLLGSPTVEHRVLLRRSPGPL